MQLLSQQKAMLLSKKALGEGAVMQCWKKWKVFSEAIANQNVGKN